MVIIAVEETPFLMAVHGVVRGVEVEHDMLTRHEIGGDELIDKDLGSTKQRLTVDTVLKPAEGWGRGQGHVGVRDLAGRDLERRIGPKFVVVVEIFVAQHDGGDALGEHGMLVMNGEDRIPGVRDDGIEGVKEPGLLGNLADQEGASVGREPAPQEVGDDRLVHEGGKLKRLAVTVCHSGGPTVWREGSVT